MQEGSRGGPVFLSMLASLCCPKPDLARVTALKSVSRTRCEDVWVRVLKVLNLSSLKIPKPHIHRIYTDTYKENLLRRRRATCHFT